MGFGPSPMEIAVIAVIALIVLGPARLPEMARSLGKGMREMRGAFSGEGGDSSSRRLNDADEEDDYDDGPDVDLDGRDDADDDDDLEFRSSSSDVDDATPAEDVKPAASSA